MKRSCIQYSFFMRSVSALHSHVFQELWKCKIYVPSQHTNDVDALDFFSFRKLCFRSVTSTLFFSCSLNKCQDRFAGRKRTGRKILKAAWRKKKKIHETFSILLTNCILLLLITVRVIYILPPGPKMLIFIHNSWLTEDIIIVYNDLNYSELYCRSQITCVRL